MACQHWRIISGRRFLSGLFCEVRSITVNRPWLRVTRIQPAGSYTATIYMHGLGLCRSVVTVAKENMDNLCGLTESLVSPNWKLPVLCTREGAAPCHS